MANTHSIRYLERSHVAFTKIDNGIYRVLKIRSEFQYRYETSFKKGDYVSTATVVDVLNNGEQILILDDRMNYIHANFQLEEDEE